MERSIPIAPKLIMQGGTHMVATFRERAEAGDIPWWLVLIQGISLLILGLLLLAKPGMTIIILVQVVGIYWFIGGIFGIIGIFLDSTAWGWKLFSGILGILAGIVVIRHPLWAPAVAGSALIIILGIEGIIMGAIGIYQAFKGAGWAAGILGAITLLIGILLLANVWLFTFSLPWTIGILCVVGGILAIIMAFRVK
jgi:uncharacterized membrane protein HdeD (DUF308 family)